MSNETGPYRVDRGCLVMNGNALVRHVATEAEADWYCNDLNKAYRAGVEADRAALLSVVRDLAGFAQHDEGCGLNADRRSYAYANGCSCGLDELEEMIKSTYNIEP